MARIRAAAFDLDGTIYLAETRIDGVMEVLSFLRERNVDIFFFTNNSSKARREFQTRLSKMGIEAPIERIYSSAYATAAFLSNEGLSPVYCFGSDGLKREIEDAGVRIALEHDRDIRAVVVGLDMTFDYGKMGIGLNLLKNRECKLVLCNRDRNFPVGEGRLMPGSGPIAAALEFASGRNADREIGKPEGYMLEMLCRDWKLRHEEILVVGDSYDSDIVMARRFGSPSVHIDTEGEGSRGTPGVRRMIEMISLLEAGEYGLQL